MFVETEKSEKPQHVEFDKMTHLCSELLSVLPDNDEIVSCIVKLESIDIGILSLPVQSEKWPGSLIQCWLQVQLVGNPGADRSTLIDKLQILQRIKGTKLNCKLFLNPYLLLTVIFRLQ